MTNPVDQFAEMIQKEFPNVHLDEEEIKRWRNFCEGRGLLRKDFAAAKTPLTEVIDKVHPERIHWYGREVLLLMKSNPQWYIGKWTRSKGLRWPVPEPYDTSEWSVDSTQGGFECTDDDLLGWAELPAMPK